MIIIEKLHPRYITDQDGKQTDIILPIEEFNDILEDIEDLSAAAERINETNIPHEKVLKELTDDGYLSSNL